MNPIGGYFELELRKGKEYHTDAIRLNSGRNAFEYILRAREYKKVYLPYFTCDVMLEPILKLKLKYEFYHINEQLEPIFDFNKIGEDETFLYTNYFGIKSLEVTKISKTCPNLIIDNSQAFFEKPLAGIDTFYSPRKFLGVPDGSYLYTDKYLQIELVRDKSFTRFSHLIKRIEEGAEIAYGDFKANDESIKGQSIKLMSSLTQALLCNVDYNNVIEVRKRNFLFINENLKNINKLKLPDLLDFVPMVFPFWTDKVALRNLLIQNKIFIAQYWPNVLKWLNNDTIEYNLVTNVVHLPLDQRCHFNELEKIMKLISYVK